MTMLLSSTPPDATALAQWPCQIKATAEATRSPQQRSLAQRFPELLPARPYASDDLHDGLLILARPHALRRRHIQFNPPSVYRWMLHDIDDGDAYHVHDDAYLPPPNIIAINRTNGHGHAAYLMATPVARHSAARTKPLRYFAMVERGVTRRLCADRQYRGLIAKNPLHPAWRVEWRRDRPYSLDELADWLFPRDLAPEPSPALTFGAGRNCALFDELRSLAYREVRTFKKRGAIDAYHHRLHGMALASNADFAVPLGPSEVRAIVKSVVRWTWGRFSDEGFSRRQSILGKRGAAKRWAGHAAVEQTQPWIADGISRRTWYRRNR